MSKESFKESFNQEFTQYSNSLHDYMKENNFELSEKYILLYLHSYKNLRKHYTSRRQIALDCDLCYNTVKKALNKFVALNLIEIIPHGIYIKIYINIRVKGSLVISKNIEKTPEISDEEQEETLSLNNTIPVTELNSTVSTVDRHRINIQNENNRINVCKREGIDTHANNSTYPYQKEENEINAYQSKELMDHWEQCGLEISDNENIKYNALKTLMPYVAKLRREGHTLETLKKAVSNYAKEFLDKDSIYTFKYKINSFFALNGKGECPAVKFSDLFYCEDNFKRYKAIEKKVELSTDEERQALKEELRKKYGDLYF